MHFQHKNYVFIVLYFRLLMAAVKEDGNNTKHYHQAGLHIVLTDALLGLDTNTCDMTCLNEKISESSGSRWRGWMVSLNGFLGYRIQ